MLNSADVRVLEKKRLKYKLNKFFKISMPFMGVMIIGLIIYLFYPQFKNIKNMSFTSNETNQSVVKAVEEKKSTLNIVEKKEVKTVIPEIKKEPKVITNSVAPTAIDKKASSNMIENANTISSKKEKDSTLSLHTNFLTLLEKEPKVDSSELMTKTKKKAVIKIESKQANKKHYANSSDNKRRKKAIKELPKDVKINFEGKNVDYLKKMFKKTNKFKYSVAIAEEYYLKNEYKKSIKWSLISNDINNKDARSWIYFAKSKVKLNQRNEAMEALKLFLKDHKSRAAAKLLSRIKHGAI